MKKTILIQEKCLGKRLERTKVSNEPVTILTEKIIDEKNWLIDIIRSKNKEHREKNSLMQSFEQDGKTNRWDNRVSYRYGFHEQREAPFFIDEFGLRCESLSFD